MHAATPPEQGTIEAMPLRPITAAAYLTRRHPQLIRRWVYAGRLTHTACDTRTRALLVDIAETVRLSAEVQKRHVGTI